MNGEGPMPVLPRVGDSIRGEWIANDSCDSDEAVVVQVVLRYDSGSRFGANAVDVHVVLNQTTTAR